jgi:predicted nucleic acid-binding protein
MSNKIICNASPLIFLSKIGRLHLLSDLFSDVLVPNSAWDEATQKPDEATKNLEELKSSGKIIVFAVKNEVAVSALIGRLHIGEVEVIVSAGELGIQNVILDDGYARDKAKQMGLSVSGTLGVLIAGYKKGIVEDLFEEIDNLRKIGFRISESIIEQIRISISAGE